MVATTAIPDAAILPPYSEQVDLAQHYDLEDPLQAISSYSRYESPLVYLSRDIHHSLPSFPT